MFIKLMNRSVPVVLLKVDLTKLTEHHVCLAQSVACSRCRMREDEELRLAEEARQNARQLAEAAERERKRKEFNKAMHFEAAQLSLGQELTKAFTYSYMQLMHTLGLKASAQKPYESESRLYRS